MRQLETSNGARNRLVMVGVSHKKAPVELRERAHVDLRLARELCPRLAAESGEAAILSTCNRSEIYLATADVGRASALAHDELAGAAELGGRQLRSVVSVLTDSDAAAHLFAVAAGLESMVVGETQILGQVREAHRAALELRSSGPVLDRLFRQAVQTGRRIRSETGLLEAPTSIPSAATRLAEALIAPLESTKALVIGAGRASELVLLNLVHRHCGRIVVANRTLARARELAVRFGAEPITLDHLEAALVEADLVISCTASTRIVLSAADIHRAVVRRKGRPMLLIDLAVPRDLDPAIASFRDCHLYNVDDLEEVVALGRVDRAREVAQARAIVDEETDKFRRWQLSLDVVPAIASLRRFADEIRATELRRAESTLGRLSPRERRHVEVLTAQIVNKLLHEPTVRMKRAASGPAGPAYAGAVQHLFGLGEEPR
jgi:glutamyl-tRNA reductase